MDIKSAAYILYIQGLQQNEIAEIVKVSLKTISTWVGDGDWKKKREDQNTWKETSSEKVRFLISHNLTVLERIAVKLQEGLEDDLSIDELKKKLIDKGDADGLSKLFAQIKGKEAEWDTLVKNIQHFFEYLESQDLKLAQKAYPFATEYMNQKRKES